MRWTCLFAITAISLIGCNYSTTSRTARGIRSIAIPFFENRTSEPNLEISVTERIVEYLVDDNTLKVVDEDLADAVLDGEILGFDNLPFSFNQELNAEEYHVIITIQVTLFSKKLNEPIWENKKIKGDGSYFLDVSEEGFSYEDALQEAIKEITDRILNLTVQDW